VIIWTDVDGVLTADPRLVPQARTIPVISIAKPRNLLISARKSASENIEARGASGDPRVDPQQLRPSDWARKSLRKGKAREAA